MSNNFFNRLDKIEKSIAASNPAERLQRRADDLFFAGVIRPRVSGHDTEDAEQSRIDLAELEHRHILLDDEPADPAMMLIVKQRMAARGGSSI